MLEKAGRSVAEAGSSVSRFFGNMFGGGSSTTSTPPAQEPVATATAPPEAQTSASAVMTAANPDGAIGSDWGQSTEVRASGKPSKVAMAPPPPSGASPVSTGAIAPTPATSKPLKGKYVLQIGAVRTRAEADQLAQKVKAEHAAALGGREPVIDEAVVGNFGSFHRVRIAPYAEAKEPGRLCGTLMKSGFDCLVLTQ
jgi:cell division septation protein DedD